VRPLATLGAASLLSLGLLAGRIAYSGRSTYDFLAWNLLLAVIPLVLALQLDRLLQSGRRALSVAGVALWILFLPNAPYMVTDFVHLAPDAPVPLWFDVLLFSTYAWTGLLLGFVSIHVVMEHARPRLGTSRTWLLTVIILAASSLAVYLGRFEYLNSWDLLVRPQTVLGTIFSPRSLPRLTGFTAGYTAFLLVAYANVEALIGSRGMRALAASGASRRRSGSPSAEDSRAAQAPQPEERRSRRRVRGAPPPAS
jgi:uncharacterized membrane protein